MNRAEEAIKKKLRVDPEQYGEPLKRSLAGLYKLKASSLRIVYSIHAEAREVWVLTIANRRDVWEAASQTTIVERKGDLAELQIAPMLSDVGKQGGRQGGSP